MFTSANCCFYLLLINRHNTKSHTVHNDRPVTLTKMPTTQSGQPLGVEGSQPYPLGNSECLCLLLSSCKGKAHCYQLKSLMESVRESFDIRTMKRYKE